MPDLAATLERLADGGARELYGGELGRAVVEHLADHGGLDHGGGPHRVPRRSGGARFACRYEGREFVSNPPPSSGGILIGYGLSLLDRLVRGRRAGQRRGDRGARRGDAGAVAGARRQLRQRPLPRRARRQAVLRRQPRRGARANRAARGGGTRGTRLARDDPHLGRRRAGERRVADGVDRLRLRRDRARHRHPHEQHARRVRPEPAREPCSAGSAPDEHDGALARSRPRAAAPRRRQRRLDPAAGRDHADRDQRRPATECRSRRRSPRRGSTSTTATSTARAAATPPSSTGWRASATSSSAGGVRTSTSAAPRPWSDETTAASPRPATRAAAATGSSCRA